MYQYYLVHIDLYFKYFATTMFNNLFITFFKMKAKVLS